MDDRTFVHAMASRDPRGLEGAYRRYADRLYAYSRSFVGDGDTAADVVHDTFVIANERVTQLRDPERLGAWLYAIARSECLRVLRRRKRTIPLVESYDVAAETPEPAANVQAAEVRALVRAASDGLSPGDREVIELAVRHGMSTPDLAAVLGVSANHAHARLSRARTQLEGALGALLVARAGRGRCADLDEMLHGWDGHLTALLRKRINRHVKDCVSCESGRREWLSPTALLAVYAALPLELVARELLAPPPPTPDPALAQPPQAQPPMPDPELAPPLSDQPWGPGAAPAQPPPPVSPSGPEHSAGQPLSPSTVDPAANAPAAPPRPGLAAGRPLSSSTVEWRPDRRLDLPDPPPFDRATGFPVAQPEERRRRSLVAAILILLLLLGGGAAVVLRAPDGAPGDLASEVEKPAANPADQGFGAPSGQPTAPPTGTPPSDQPPSDQPPSDQPPPGVPSDDPTFEPPPPPPPPTTSPPLVIVLPLTLHTTGRRSCPAGTFQLTVGAEIRNGVLGSMRLYWRVLLIRNRTMEIINSTSARLTVPVFGSNVEWWVVATASDGRTVQSDPATLTNPCP